MYHFLFQVKFIQSIACILASISSVSTPFLLSPIWILLPWLPETFNTFRSSLTFVLVNLQNVFQFRFPSSERHVMPMITPPSFTYTLLCLWVLLLNNLFEFMILFQVISIRILHSYIPCPLLFFFLSLLRWSQLHSWFDLFLYFDDSQILSPTQIISRCPINFSYTFLLYYCTKESASVSYQISTDERNIVRVEDVRS